MKCWKTRPLFLVHAIFFVGIVEETAKLLPFLVVCLRLDECDEPIDGFVYAGCVALGFASYENLFWLEQQHGAAFLARAFASPVVHTLFASVWGYAIMRRKAAGRPWRRVAIVTLLAAALLHGGYDFLATDARLRPVAALLVLAVWLWQLAAMRRKRSAEAVADGKPALD